MQQITSLNFSLVQAAVDRKAVSLGLTQSSQAFIHAMLDAIYPTKEQDNLEIITDGAGDRGIDAIYIQDVGERINVDLHSYKYRESSKNCNKNFESNEIDKIRSFMSDLFDQDSNSLRNSNQMIREKCDEIISYFKSGKICQFRLFLVSNGLPLHDKDREHLKHFCQSLQYVDFEEIDFFSTVKLLAEQPSLGEVAKLRAVDDQIFARNDGDVEGVIANIDASSFLESIRDSQTGSIKRHLFSDNIRVYLGDEGGYNRDIISSALAEDNHLFWYLNNGITIVCDRVEFQKGIRNPVITVRDFQIVNGAQTCHALFSAYGRNPEVVSKVLLLARIYETGRQDISNRVAIATNSQARINLRDLHSNDEVQKKIEQVLLSQNVFYERKKNQHAEQISGLRVDALKLGQMILAYKLREPDKCKTESDSIFGSRYHLIFNDALDGEWLAKLAFLYAEIENRRDEIRILQRQIVAEEQDAKILSYGHWHVLFAVGMLAESDGISIPGEGDLIEYIQRAEALVFRIAGEYKSIAQYDMFRSPRFRERLVGEFYNQQLPLPIDLSGSK
jgi:hypothetical protein